MNANNHILLKHFDKAVELIERYRFNEPLHFFLKKYFSENKQHGSKDRKNIVHFCYTFFRIGKNFEEKTFSEKLKAALFLCENSLEKYAPLFTDNFLINHSEDPAKRISFIQKIYPDFSLRKIFSYEKELSESIDVLSFQQSFLAQPKVFLRIRNGMKNFVSEKLSQAKIAFETVDEDAISVAQTTDVNNVLNINKDVTVQDLSSQKIKSFLQLITSLQTDKSSASPIHIWDCCAASGGKSILAKDVFGRIDLTVSDIRPQILHNLKNRFAEAGIRSYKSFKADLTVPQPIEEKFDLIICDAPCSGSGTWARTPEMLLSFQQNDVEKYQSLQKKIINNSISHVKNGGYFLYITCSVFRKENEVVAEYITGNFSAKCIKSESIKGYTHHADSMFAALFVLQNNF